jgi:hypothetical protein
LRHHLGRFAHRNLTGAVDQVYLRSGPISSQMMGFALVRYVRKPVASMPDDELASAIAPNLQHYVDGDLTG